MSLRTRCSLDTNGESDLYSENTFFALFFSSALFYIFFLRFKIEIYVTTKPGKMVLREWASAGREGERNELTLCCYKLFICNLARAV